MVDRFIIIDDFGTEQSEAVGMAAVDAPKISLDVAIAVAVPSLGAISLQSILTDLIVNDIGDGLTATNINAMLGIIDDAQSLSTLEVAATVPLTFSGIGLDTSDITASIPIPVSGFGIDYTSAAKAYFYITRKGVLEPMGLTILRDSRHDLLPGTRDVIASIPGRHGAYDFGSGFNQRTMELKVASRERIGIEQRAQIKRTLAKHLNPLIGKQPLVFAEDIEKTYMVKATGQIDTSMSRSWLEFTIPLTGDPIILGSFEKQHVGSGVLNNEGTYETPLSIRIVGAVTNPSVIVGSKTLTWNGIMTAGDVLEIDTEHMTVKHNGINALANYTGGFPQIQPGTTTVTGAAVETTWHWRDRWI